MSDYDTLPIGPKLSDEQLSAIYAWVDHTGRERRRSQGADNFNEADFLAGVMVAFFALESQDKLLGGWVFGPLGGVSMFDRKDPDPDAPTVRQPPSIDLTGAPNV